LDRFEMPSTEVATRKHRVSVTSLKRAHAQLNKPHLKLAAKVWTQPMTGIAVTGVLIALFLMFVADEAILRAVKASNSPIIQFMSDITNIGKSDRYLIPSAILFLFTGFLDWSAYRQKAKSWLLRLFGQSAYLFGSVAGSGILVNILKVPIGRARPKLFDSAGAIHFEPFSIGYDFASFPSGHSTTMGAVTMVAMVWFPKWRWLILPIGFFLAATRIAAQAHYPSDVVAGFTLGMLFALSFARWLAARSVVFRLQTGRMFPKKR
jgi:membrane-associated phospholipid phosphatase